MDNQQDQAALRIIETFANNLGMRAFVVGGAVRDHILYHRSQQAQGIVPILRDIDVMIEGDARTFAEAANVTFKGKLQKFDTFLTAKISDPAALPEIAEIDFASTRTESYPKPGALPSVNLSTLEHDLKRRDFSINAMAIELSNAQALIGQGSAIESQSIIDLFNGQEDLKRGEIRVLHDASFVDDPTRLFRAIRYQCRFGFKFEANTAALFTSAVDAKVLSTISSVRIFNEIKKMSREVHAATEMLMLSATHGLLTGWPPAAGLSTQELSDLISKIGKQPLEIELLKELYKRNPAIDPREWGLNLSKKMLAEITLPESPAGKIV